MSLDLGYSYCINLTKEEKLEIDKQVRKNRFELKFAIFFPFLPVPMIPQVPFLLIERHKKLLTKEVVEDAIQVYAENNGYYLKFYATHFDIKTLNVLKNGKVAKSKLLDDLLEKGELIDIENYDLIDFNIKNILNIV